MRCDVRARARSPRDPGSIASSLLHATLILGLAFADLAPGAAARAEDAPAESATRSAAELEELVGPIALYPDELLAIVLPASTYPLQIVQAARLLEKRKQDPDLQPDEDWDPSVIGLMNYPDVIDRMNTDLDWTWKLGDAVAEQQADVMDAIQAFRAKADAAGNLASNDKVTVVKETEEKQQIIVIESASPEVIYVPQYQPSTVIVQQPAPYPYYYSPPYPYYYNPAAVFWTGMFVGAAIGWGMNWGWGHHGSNVYVNHNVNVNVNRPTRPSTPNRPNRPTTRPGAGGGRPEAWKPDRRPGSQVGGRPGGGARPSTGALPSGGTRPGSGGRPGAGARPSTGALPSGGARPSTGALPSGGARPGTGGRPSASTRPSTSRPSGRDLTSPSGSGGRSARPSSFGSYGSGSQARASASRGAASRSSMRGGGGRGGGGRRR